MEWLDVLGRIEAGEGRTTEFKRGLDLSAVGRVVCAFANTEGGVIIFGVDDSQAIVGVQKDPERVQEQLTSFLETGCSAPVNARVGRHQDTKGWVHWLEIPKQRGFEPLCSDGRVWIRREHNSMEPSPVELQDLYNGFGCGLTEDRSILTGALAHIDLERFRLYLQALGLDTEEEPQPDDETDLRNRGVVAEMGKSLHPTLYGVLAFGNDPQRYPQTRNFRVECVRYEGDSRASRVLQVADASGRLDDQVQRAIGWIGLRRSKSYDGLIREDRPLLPRSVIREALVNAVVHRDYAVTGSQVLLEVFTGRVDLTSPGPLPNHRRVESVLAGAHPRSRNGLLANFMLTMGYMERRGRGWPMMRRAMRKFNGTEPELVHDPDGKFVRVTFRLE